MTGPLLFTNRKKLLALVCLCAATAAQARELDRYLITGPEGPARCKKITELSPVNEKVTAFYEGKFAAAIPTPVDRHAQSFDCEGQKGTFYFFQYKTVRDKDQALLFARPVLTKGTGSPLILDWSGGFVILSFAQVPADLKAILEEKVAPPPLFQQASVDTFVVTAGTTTAVEIPISSTTIVLSVSTMTVTPVVSSTTMVPVLSTTAVTLSSPTAPPSPTSLSISSSPTVKPLLLKMPDDISADTLKAIRRALACRDSDLPKELVQPCEWFKAFRKAGTVTPVVVSTGARIGQGYRLYEDGSLGGDVFQAAVGSGKIGEINLYPHYPESGVEEMELRGIVATPADRPVPKPTGDMAQRLENFARPTGRTFMRTKGESWLAHRPHQSLYLRAAGELWLLVTVETPREDPAEPRSFTVSAFR